MIITTRIDVCKVNGCVHMQKIPHKQEFKNESELEKFRKEYFKKLHESDNEIEISNVFIHRYEDVHVKTPV